MRVPVLSQLLVQNCSRVHMQILTERGFEEVIRSPVRVAEPAVVQPNIAAMQVVRLFYSQA